MQRVICVRCFCYFLNNEKHFQISLTYKNNVIKSNEKLSASRNYPLVIEKSIKWDDKHYKNLLAYLEGANKE